MYIAGIPAGNNIAGHLAGQLSAAPFTVKMSFIATPCRYHFYRFERLGTFKKNTISLLESWGPGCLQWLSWIAIVTRHVAPVSHL